MKMTPARVLWLKELRDKGPLPRIHGPTGYKCHEAGYTEWVYTDDNDPGAGFLSMDEARDRYPKEFWEHCRSAGERITEAGLKALEET